jgi:hypothetical protein
MNIIKNTTVQRTTANGREKQNIMKKILLKTNTGAEQEIAMVKQNYINGKNLLNKLAELGLELTEVKNWTNEVLPHFMGQFPNATLDFNLEASGLKAAYNEALQLYKLSAGRFTKPTEADFEAIAEKYKVYASSEMQLEAYNLVHSIIADLQRLNGFGAYINASYLPNLSSLMTSVDGVPAVADERLANWIQAMK